MNLKQANEKAESRKEDERDIKIREKRKQYERDFAQEVEFDIAKFRGKIYGEFQK